ncbi:hypothetical protein HDV00_007078 [Rhizophlyctis rosea]|nr:hypothetical protein HDV00_007078 [Rhizophlyctis rosea]
MTDLSVDLPTAADLREATAAATPQTPIASSGVASSLTANADPTPQTATTPRTDDDGADITALSPSKSQLNASKAEAPAPAPKVKQAPPAQSGWGWGGGFSWNGIVDAVKKQSEAVVDVYKRDIAEFVSVVTTESTTNIDRLAQTFHNVVVGGDEEEDQPTTAATSNNSTPQRALRSEESSDDTAREDASAQQEATEGDNSEGPDFVAELEKVADKAETLLNSFSAGLSSFLSGAVAIVPPLLEEEPRQPKKILYDRKSALLEALRSDPKTYLVDPSAPNGAEADASLAERFESFKSTYNAPEQTAVITRLLSENGGMKELMDRLVPDEISAEDFWLRYFFRVTELEREEVARKKLMTDANPSEDEEFTWGSDDEEDEPHPVPAPQPATSTSAPASPPRERTESQPSAQEGKGEGEADSSEVGQPVEDQRPERNGADLSDSFEVLSNKVASTDGERSEDDWGDWE